MRNFEFYAPTRIVFGKDTETQVGGLLKEYGATKVLLHFGGQSAERSGLLGRVRASLNESGVDFVELGGVVPNPRLSLVYKGIELCKKEGVDFILAVGGGSVIDSSKGIGYGLNYDGDVWDLYTKKATSNVCTPQACVLTLAAAGSEMSNSSVLTKDEGMLKRSYSHDCSRLKFSILNPELTYTLPKYQTSCGVVDIMMHTMERYFTTDEPMMMTDAIAEGVMRTAMQNGRVLMADPNNYNARAEVMWAGSLSHNNLTQLGSNPDFATHQMEHELSGLFDVAHGAGLAALWCSWARYVCATKPERFESFAKNVFGLEGENLALRGIEAMEDYYKEVEMPISIPELLGRAATEAELDEMAYKCAFEGTRSIGGFQTLDQSQIREIYVMANK
ncbi:iron-containing alcohol dehydrogenase [Chakrabartyella piscis]|uniref:iron-containing alcohol dehydrogenase n=1 Tax=Chakrabartyella piscis TaxID=2918914 RepID=UPI0029589762|nr:iron-containing alcohol dehydrogenase [Chakrabartyella piscis]